MLSKAHLRLMEIVQDRGARVVVCKRTQMAYSTLRGILSGKDPTVRLAFGLRDQYGIPLEDWLTAAVLEGG
jgi:hypothetical protein